MLLQMKTLLFFFFNVSRTQRVKNPPAMPETWVRSLGWEDPLEEEMATHSSILAGESHGQRSLVGYSPRGHKESDTTCVSDLHNKCNRTYYWRAWVWSEMALSLDLRPCYRPAQLSQRATPSNRVSVLHLLNGNNTSEWKWKSLSRVWLCDPMGSTVRGILQARILEWVAFPFRGSSQPRDQTQVSCIAGRFFTSWSTREAQEYWSG